jgi:hypothetical protein
VAFIADSQRSQSMNNRNSFENLMANAALVGLDVAALPMVVQFNKRDLQDILSEEEIRARWAKAPWPLSYASALEGSGVRETFNALLDSVYTDLDSKFALGSEHRLSRQAFIAAAGGLT